MAGATQRPEPDDQLVDYVWPYGRKTTGRLRAPAGYTVETRNYTEGVITHLRYPDGSFILLHWGGMIKLPLLDAPEYVLSSAQTRAGRRVRIGVSENADRHLREDALPPGQDVFPLNIAYGQVPAERLRLFNAALDSYERIPRKATPN